MKNILRIMLEGSYTNLKRILFAADRVTDMELRRRILEGKVEPEPKVAEVPCIGCAGCSNACPTGAAEMKDLDEPVEIAEGLVKTQIPVINSEKCVHCYYCHDFCPLYALFGQPGTIHPNDVGEVEFDAGEVIQKPVKISEDKIKFIAQFLADRSIIERKNSLLEAGKGFR